MSKIARLSDVHFDFLQNMGEPGVDTLDDAFAKIIKVLRKMTDQIYFSDAEISKLVTNLNLILSDTKVKRLPRGEKTSAKTFKDFVLISLYLLGGSATTKEVQRKAHELFGSTFKSVDFQKLSDGKTIRWENTACFARDDLVKEQFIFTVEEAARGIWKLTHNGTLQAESLLGKYSDLLEAA